MKGKNKMDQAPKNQISIRKMADGVRVAVFLSLASNIYQIYQFMKEPGDVAQAISIGLGIVGTFLIWKCSQELRAEKKQALHYWLALALTGYVRWMFIDGTFDLNVASMLVMSIMVIFTARIMIWIRNKSLT
jgi:hypothetical protein